jgi:hypothetical protein
MKVRLKTIDKDVAAAATPERLVSDTLQVSGVRIRAKSSNTDSMFVGPVGEEDYELPPGEEIQLDVMMNNPGSGLGTIDLHAISIRAAVDGEGVSCAYIDRTQT